MSATYQAPVGSGRAGRLSRADARRPQELRLVLEYLRSHDQLARSPNALRDRQAPELGMDPAARF